MDTETGHAPRPEGRAETHAEPWDRLAWEAEGIAEARAELDAGLSVDIADVRAWVDSLGTNTPLPLPLIRHPCPRRVPRRLPLAPHALADLDDALTWLTQPGSGRSAWRKLDMILAAIENLPRLPVPVPFRPPFGRARASVRRRLAGAP